MEFLPENLFLPEYIMAFHAFWFPMLFLLYGIFFLPTPSGKFLAFLQDLAQVHHCDGPFPN